MKRKGMVPTLLIVKSNGGLRFPEQPPVYLLRETVSNKCKFTLGSCYDRDRTRLNVFCALTTNDIDFPKSSGLTEIQRTQLSRKRYYVVWY